MCQVGDIIVVFNATNNHRPIGPHPFIVLDDTGGVISGIYEYSFVGLVITSYDDNDEERKQKLSQYATNLHLAKDDREPNDEDTKNGIVRVSDFFFFNKDRIKYKTLGRLNPDVFNLVIEFIEELAAQGVTFHEVYDKTVKKEESS